MMDFATFQRLAADERARGAGRFVIPVYKRLSADLLTPVSAFLALREPGAYGFLLESVEGGEKLARYSFLGKNPYRIVRAFGEQVTVEERTSGGVGPTSVEEAWTSAEGARTSEGRRTSVERERTPEGVGRTSAGEERTSEAPTNGQAEDVFAVLQRMIGRYAEVRVPGLPRLTGGAVGYLGYDAVRLVERLPSPPPDDLNLPDAVWCFYDAVAAFDHVRHQIVLMAHAFVEEETDVEPGAGQAVGSDARTSDLEALYDGARARIGRLEEELGRPPFKSPEPVEVEEADVRSNVARDDFEGAVEAAKRYIYEGDIFQVVLSQRFEMGFRGDRFNLYRALRQVNPSPYLFYLDFDAFALVGSSPEVLVRVEDGKAEVLPIAGTRRRGESEGEDRQLEVELLADPKERAEHLMLVDLGRNDLGRVCTYRTVEVERYAYVERYSHVMHIVSSVAGRLAPGRGAVDVLAACFPAGTVSGAPKVRAMELIDELETSKRGVYAGAVGYVDFSGNLDTCIAIRTMVVQGGTVYVQAGAGIVADSDPAKEYEETVSKAQALRQAIRLAGEGLL